MAAKPAVSFPAGTFRSSAKVTSVAKADSDDDTPQRTHHELFTEYTFNADGTYAMHGYPPIAEKGQIVVREKIGQEYHIRLANRLQTAQKKDEKMEWKPAEIDGVIRFAGDLKSFTWDAKAFYSYDPNAPKEAKKEKKEKKEKKASSAKKNASSAKKSSSAKKEKSPHKAASPRKETQQA